jgi:hypothetical protein
VKTEATVGERREKKVMHEQHREFLQGVTFSNEKKVTFQEQLAAILPSLLLADNDPAVMQLAPAMEKLKEALSEMIYSGMTMKQIAEQARWYRACRGHDGDPSRVRERWAGNPQRDRRKADVTRGIRRTRIGASHSGGLRGA